MVFGDAVLKPAVSLIFASFKSLLLSNQNMLKLGNYKLNNFSVIFLVMGFVS
jgi:hypothetical protein